MASGRREERATVLIKDPANPKGPRIRVLRNPRGTPTGDSLYLHRTMDLRTEQRASLLAYGFLRGRRYAQVEPPCTCVMSCGHVGPDMSHVGDIAARFGRLPKDKARAAVLAWWRGEAPGQTAAPVSTRGAPGQYADVGVTSPAMLR